MVMNFNFMPYILLEYAELVQNMSILSFYDDFR